MIKVKPDNECEFCKELFTGSCNDDLFEKKIPVFEGSGFYILLNVYIMDDELHSDIYDSDDNSILNLKRKVNYCPMCGRRLINEKDIQEIEEQNTNNS